VNVGDELRPVVKGPLEREQFAEYGQAALDGNPIHTDEEFAKQSGYESVFAQGMLSMGFLGQMLVENAGVGNVRRFKVRFAKITWPGETITCRGVITRKYEEKGLRLVDCDVHTETETGEKRVEGTATLIAR
ncbi:MAG: MaoC/PaaZ C-terminal domain-containing protein, partial [Candidatus Binatia bacterium]